MHHLSSQAFELYGKKLVDILNRYPDDFHTELPRLSYRSSAGVAQKPARTFGDRFGCLWEERITGILGQVIKPALVSWDQLSGYQMPSPLFQERDSFEREKLRLQMHKRSHYALGAYEERYGSWKPGGFYYFQRLIFLRGFENLMLDLIDDREELYILADRLLEFLLDSIEICLKMGVDGILLAEDWGTQNSLMIDPGIWRRFFKSKYRRIFDLIHQYAAHVFFHSDGYTLDIVPDLIEIGADVLNLQFSCMDLLQLSALTRGKVCILTDLDRQHLLPFGRPEEIEPYVGQVMQLFGTPVGGIILRGKIEADVPLANVEAMYSAFDRHGNS